MEKHVQIVAILQIICGILGILIGIICFIAIAGGGMLSGDYEAIWITSMVATFLAIFFIVLSIPALVGGIFLLKKANWARILVIIISVLNLINIPIGTIIGAYSLWVLLNAETTKLFSGQT